jgi:hypothetical protein
MSIEAVSAILNMDVSDSTAKLVLIGLANHADESGECYPSQARLAKYASCTRRTVVTKIKWLVEYEFIESRSQSNEAGGRGVNRYRLLLPPVKDIHTPCETGFTPPVKTVSHEPSLKPSENTSSLRSEDADRVPVDPAKPVYDFGKKLLGKEGLSAGKAGALITKWLKSHGPPAVMAALEAAAEQERHDIVAWIHGALRNETDETETIDLEAIAGNLRRRYADEPEQGVASAG